MNNSLNKNSMFIVSTGIIIAISRFLLGHIISTDTQHILIVMAVVNYVALGFVLLFLYNELYRRCKDKISSSGLDTLTKKKCNSVVFTFSVTLLVLYLSFGIIYMICLKSNDLNDVISIIALSISIATNGLVDDYYNSYYRLVLNIAKHLISSKNKKQKKTKSEGL